MNSIGWKTPLRGPTGLRANQQPGATLQKQWACKCGSRVFSLLLGRRHSKPTSGILTTCVSCGRHMWILADSAIRGLKE